MKVQISLACDKPAKVGADEIVKALNAKLDADFNVADFHAWIQGKGAPQFIAAVKSYVSLTNHRVAAALGAIAANLKLTGRGI